MTALLGLSLAGMAKATDDIYITGSTAVAGAFFQTCTNPGAIFTTAPSYVMYGGLGAGVDAQYAFYGTLVGGSGTTYIICNFGGSESGLQAVANNGAPTLAYMTETFINGYASGTDIATNGFPLTGNTVNHKSDIAFADNVQADSPTAYAHGVYQALTVGAPVAQIPFKFVRNNGWWKGTNITSSAIRQILTGGALRAVVSGNTADTNDWVYFAGRASSSGTRVNYLGDTSYGISIAVKQIEMNANGSLSSSAGQYTRDWGNSAAAIATAFDSDTTGFADPVHAGKTGYSAIACLGYTDTAAAVAGGHALELSYNGVPFTYSNIVNGTYTLWGNEYIYQTYSMGYSGQSAQVHQAYLNFVASFPANCDGKICINSTQMKATRGSAAGDVVHTAQ